MPSERTLVLIKPDAVQRALLGPIVTRLERTGYKIIGVKMLHVDQDLAAKLYAEHKAKPFYDGLVKYITSSPLVAMVLSGPEVVAKIRQLMGATNPLEAAPGTIRGDFGEDIGRNLVHGSATVQDAQREVPLFFGEDEIMSYHRGLGPWILDI
ncbi:MAG: nucleoside-diphosphate kinase [Gemmatimonadetes bacterium]|nr:nucleoside-diphosphate kinase [Gemmatimonadota bacterium]